jgi:hypothetical protein
MFCHDFAAVPPELQDKNGGTYNINLIEKWRNFPTFWARIPPVSPLFIGGTFHKSWRNLRQKLAEPP